MPIRVVLADDHAVVRDGLRMVLEARNEVVVVGDAGNGREALELIRELTPDVAVLDVSMPELNGIDAAARVPEVSPETRVVILSMHATSEHIFRALQAGAKGYVLKESAGKEVVTAVKTVYNGQQYFSQKVTEAMVDDYLHTRGQPREKSPIASLSPRERQVLQLVVEGKSSTEIAEQICLSPKTVETYRGRIMQKLGIKDLPGLVKFAIQHGLTPMA